MTDKEFEREKKRVQKYIDKWFNTLGMGWFDIEMHWERERDPDMPETAAKTTSQWQYRNGKIIWFVPALADNEDRTLENIIVHEFVHVLLSSTTQLIPEDKLDHLEYATETIARAIIWARGADK